MQNDKGIFFVVVTNLSILSSALYFLQNFIWNIRGYVLRCFHILSKYFLKVLLKIRLLNSLYSLSNLNKKFSAWIEKFIVWLIEKWIQKSMWTQVFRKFGYRNSKLCYICHTHSYDDEIYKRRWVLKLALYKIKKKIGFSIRKHAPKI